MPNRKRRNCRGVTLVEVMISLVILLVVFMGLIQASLLSIDQNVRNEARDEAVRIASETMALSRASGFSTLTDTGGVCNVFNPAIPRNFRNQTITFSSCRVIEDLDAANKQVMVTVTWSYREENLTHSINSIVRNQ